MGLGYCPDAWADTSATMPADQSGGLHDDEGLTPVEPARQHRESDPAGMGGAPWLDATFAVEG
jgi:hypothetical protein